MSFRPVSLATQVRLLPWLLALLVGFAAPALVDAFQVRLSGAAWLVLLAALLLGVWLARARLSRLLVERSYGAIMQAARRNDWQSAHQILGELRSLYVGVRGATEDLRAFEGALLAMEGNLPEARAVLESIDRTHVSSRQTPPFLNNLAWALALSGEPARAVLLAKESIDLSDRERAPASADLRAAQLGTLGAALVLSGQPSEGVEFLEQALARGGSTYHLAARGYFLGEGLRLLGRTSDAIAAYRRASEVAAGTSFAEKIEASLGKLQAYR